MKIMILIRRNNCINKASHVKLVQRPSLSSQWLLLLSVYHIIRLHGRSCQLCEGMCVSKASVQKLVWSYQPFCCCWSLRPCRRPSMGWVVQPNRRPCHYYCYPRDTKIRNVIRHLLLPIIFSTGICFSWRDALFREALQCIKKLRCIHGELTGQYPVKPTTCRRCERFVLYLLTPTFVL